jgi:hypothetical protein
MPHPSHTVVAYCISSAIAKARVVDALHPEGITPLQVTLGRVQIELRRSEPPAALVYDLMPAERAVADLMDLKAVVPRLPVLLYPPPSADVGSLLVRCGRLPLVRAQVQDPAGRCGAGLRAELRRILAGRPARQVWEIMMTLLPGRPRVVAAFLAATLRDLESNPGRPVQVSRLAAQLKRAPRSLERTCRRFALAAPREVCDWATLLFLTDAAAQAGQSTAAYTAAAGMDPQRLHRLRHRLLPRVARAESRDANREFDLVLLSFGHAFRSRRLRRSLSITHLDEWKELAPWSD